MSSPAPSSGSEITPENFQASQRITDPEGHDYDVREIWEHGNNLASVFPELASALNRQIALFTVEFLRYGEYKPHVVFRFHFDIPIQSQPHELYSCRLSMELHDGEEDNSMGPGACQIHLQGNYLERTAKARVGFTFPFRRGLTLAEVIRAVTGTHPGLRGDMRSDLAPFHFITVRPAGATGDVYDGCRDWIAHAFIRLHFLGLVEWEINGITGPELPRDGLTRGPEVLIPHEDCLPIHHIPWRNDAGFHDIIGKWFFPANTETTAGRSAASNDPRVIHYTSLPLECGLFRPNVVRFFQSVRLGPGGQVYTLPYRVLPGLSSQGGPSGHSGHGTSGGGAGHPGGSGHPGGASHPGGDGHPGGASHGGTGRGGSAGPSGSSAGHGPGPVHGSYTNRASAPASIAKEAPQDRGRPGPVEAAKSGASRSESRPSSNQALRKRGESTSTNPSGLGTTKTTTVTVNTKKSGVTRPEKSKGPSDTATKPNAAPAPKQAKVTVSKTVGGHGAKESEVTDRSGSPRGSMGKQTPAAQTNTPVTKDKKPTITKPDQVTSSSNHPGLRLSGDAKLKQQTVATKAKQSTVAGSMTTIGPESKVGGAGKRNLNGLAPASTQKA